MAVEKKIKSEKTCFSNAPRISGKRLWLFRIIAVVAVPLLLFGCLELVLRLFNVGYKTHAVIEREIDGRTMCCNNLKFGWRFFPPDFARDFPGFVFDAKKPPGTYRIFVLGSSAALGYPGPEYDFGRILEVMLNDSYPQTHFEVIVPAMVGINSHAVLEIARDCAKYDPDLFIVYAGNNEVLGPFGPGATFSSISPNLFFIRAGLALKTTRTGQLLEKIFSFWGRNAVPKQWDKMDMFLKRQVRYDSPQMEPVYRYFEKNLNDICSVARRAGASIIFSNVGCNLKDCSPFSSLHKETLNQTDRQKWQDVYQQGIINETADEYKQAINNYLAAEEIDDTFADLHFRLGRCYRRTGEYETARKHYLKARQYDTLRFRADARINDVIHSVAQGSAKERIYFVDGVAALEENSPHNTPGGELFYEHVHLNFTGNYVLARTFFERIQELVPASMKQKKSDVLSKEQCAKRLVYTYLDLFQILIQIKSIVEEPPFTNQLYHNEFVEKINKKIELWRMYLKPPRFQEELGQYESAIRERPNDWRLFWRYGILLYLSENNRDLRTGDIQVRKSIELCPYNAIAYLGLGQSLRRQGNFSEELKVLYKLLELKPNSAKGHIEIAKAHRELKNYKKVIQHLSASMSIRTAMPDKGFYVILAEAYFLTGNTNKAIKTLYDAIKTFSGKKMPLEHFYLGYLLGVKGEYKKALEESMLALKMDPNLVNREGFEECLSILKEKNNPG